MTDLRILENFYEDPEIVLSLVKEFPITGCGSGNRSLDIQMMNPTLGIQIKQKLCSIHGVDPRSVNLFTYFMEHTYDPVDDIFNRTSTHIDGKKQENCVISDGQNRLVFCGQIFLTKDVDLDVSVSISRVKPHLKWDKKELEKNCIEDYTLPGKLYRSGKINLEEFKRMRQDHENNFDLTCEVKNLYNRMVSWRAGTLHAQRITGSVPKVLNQYFFAEWL